MSNEAYEKLHKLVKYLINNGFISRAKCAEVLGLSLIDFKDEFEDELK